MRIHDDHMYHGAALIQIAEHPLFTAINSLKVGGTVIRTAYKINDEIVVYLKYRRQPTSTTYEEYTFTFHQVQLKELAKIADDHARTFVALVCVEEREICCISYGQLQDLIAWRESRKGGSEDQYTILITTPNRKSLRVYVNAPGRYGKMLGNTIIISRRAFPGIIFG